MLPSVTDETTIRNKLAEACSQRGVQAEIAKAFEVHPSTVKRWLEGSEIPPPMLKLLDWYFFGKVPPRLEGQAIIDMRNVLCFDEAEWRIIGHIARRQGITEQQWIVARIRDYLSNLEAAAALAEVKPANITPLSPSLVAEEPAEYKTTPRSEYPFYGTIAAGQPGGPLDVMDSTHPGPAGYDPKTHYVLRVNGRSMEPEYQDGSFILCRKLRDGEFATKGQDVIGCDASGTYLKRLAYTKDGKAGTTPRKPVPHLVSINPEFTEIVPVSDLPIVAVVVGKI